LQSDKLKLELAKVQEEQYDTAHRVKNWYEIVGNTLELLTNATENFSNGDMNDKKAILLAIGENPLLLNKKLVITLNDWLIPVKDEVKNLRTQLYKVRTMPDKIQKASEEAISNSWLGMRDSNPRMLVPETSALPLGESPL
jgi:hypothetical protein